MNPSQTVPTWQERQETPSTSISPIDQESSEAIDEIMRVLYNRKPLTPQQQQLILSQVRINMVAIWQNLIKMSEEQRMQKESEEKGIYGFIQQQRLGLE